jgi:hypothetical protein
MADMWQFSGRAQRLSMDGDVTAVVEGRDGRVCVRFVTLGPLSGIRLYSTCSEVNMSVSDAAVLRNALIEAMTRAQVVDNDDG